MFYVCYGAVYYTNDVLFVSKNKELVVIEGSWKCWQEFTMRSKFKGKYLEIEPIGRSQCNNILLVGLEVCLPS